MTIDLDEDLELPEPTPIRRLQPGEILGVVIKMRQLLDNFESAAYTLYASFEDLGDPRLETEANKARRTLELATSRVNSLLEVVEETPAYTALKKETLARRKDRTEREKRGKK